MVGKPFQWDAVKTRDVRFGRGGTVSFESLPSEFCENSVQDSARILSEFIHSASFRIRQKSRNLTNSQHSVMNLAKFREIFIKIGVKFDELAK